MARAKQLITAFATCLVAAGCAGHAPPASPGLTAGRPQIQERSVRGGGTRDEWIAATYIGAHLRRIDLEPLEPGGGYVQDVSVERSVASAPPVLSAGAHRFTDSPTAPTSMLDPIRWLASSDFVPAWLPGKKPQASSSVVKEGRAAHRRDDALSASSRYALR